MKTTRTCVIKHIAKKQEEELLSLIRAFESAKRYSFKRLLEGHDEKELIKILQPQYRLNKRYAEDTVLQAKTIISSQRELLPTYLENNLIKFKKTTQKIDDYVSGRKRPKKVPLEVCLTGLYMRKEKLQTKIHTYETCLEKDKLPPIIFGGRKNFYERMKGNMTNEEWKSLRTRQLYSRGDKSKKGNLNMRINVDDNGNAFLEIANPLGLEEGKRKKPRITLSLHIPKRYYNEITNVVMGTRRGFNPKGKEIIDYEKYSVELVRKDGKYYVHVTWDEEEYGHTLGFTEIPTCDVVAGIDVNPDKIAVSLCSKQGNFLGSKIFYLHNLDTFRTEKRETVIGQCIQEIKRWLLEQNVGAIVLEDLKFQQTHDTNKYTNRKFHQFTYKKMLQFLIRMGLRNGMSIKTVNPAYTSVIGKLKYSKKYGISVHETAAFTIARRGLHLEEKLPKEIIFLLKKQITLRLQILNASMEESKEKKKTYATWLQTIASWKEHHNWKLWNILHKIIYMSNQQFLFKI